MSSKTIYTCPNDEVRDLIKNYTKENTGSFHRDKHLHEILTPFGYSNLQFSQVIYDCRHNVYTQPKCTCGNELKFINYSAGYRQYCSVKCRANSPEWQQDVVNTNIEKYGVTNVSQVESIVEQKKKTFEERTGCSWLNDPESKEKIKKTNKERYGVEHAFQSLQIQEKIKKTNKERYGVENPAQSLEIQEKMKQTMLERHGVEHSLQSPEIQEKAKNTNKERYGHEYPIQSLEIQEKTRLTMLERYGVENISQCPKNHEKVMHSGFKTKLHRGFKCRGYEWKAIDLLLDIWNLNELDFTTRATEMPEIWYTFDGKNKRYFPDILMKTNGILIEVKSGYTWKADYEKNLAKMKASGAILMIFDETSRLPRIYYGDYPNAELETIPA